MATTQKTNVETAEELYEAFNRGDIETCLAGFADDITWIEPETSPLIGGTHHGKDAVMDEVVTPIAEAFDSFEVRVDRLIDGGDVVVMEGAHVVTTKAGETTDVPAVHVSEMRDGTVEKFTGYEDTALLQELLG